MRLWQKNLGVIDNLASKSASRKLGVAFYLVVVFLIVFLVVTQLFGIPLAWLFSWMRPLSAAPLERNMDVEVNPSTPILLGQEITIVVIDKENHFPIQAAKVCVSKDGLRIIELYTNEDGLVTIEYPGETTIITVKKEGYSPVMKVVPRIPDKWIMGILTAVVAGVATDWIIHFFRKKRKKARPRARPAT